MARIKTGLQILVRMRKIKKGLSTFYLWSGLPKTCLVVSFLYAQGSSTQSYNDNNMHYVVPTQIRMKGQYPI